MTSITFTFRFCNHNWPLWAKFHTPNPQSLTRTKPQTELWDCAWIFDSTFRGTHRTGALDQQAFASATRLRGLEFFSLLPSKDDAALQGYFAETVDNATHVAAEFRV